MVDVANPLDPLGEALHFLRMSGAYYCHSELTAPWALALPAVPGCAAFHVVIAGRCWLEVEGEEPRLLDPGEVALVPHGQGHRVADDPSTPPAPLDQLPHEHVGQRCATLRYGGGGAVTTLVCGAVSFEHPAAQHLISVLPKVMTVRASPIEPMEWLSGTLALMAREAHEARPGAETLIARLADVLVIRTLRHWIEHNPDSQTGWLQATRDPQIGRALTLIHRVPAQQWTVASLAAAVGMSRSVFAGRFAERAGEPVMRYIARWRMHLALTWLRERDVSLSEVASQLGYQSEAAFSRAFKRVMGTAPGAVRRSPVRGTGWSTLTPAGDTRLRQSGPNVAQ